jgi:hypothetical protein
VRAANYAAPIAGAYQRDIQLQWVAPDPIARDPNQKTATTYSGGSTVSGRTYNLGFARTYPAGGGASSNATISSPGDMAIRPLVRIYGPITKPVLTFQIQPSGTTTTFAFLASLVMDANSWVDVDAANHTVFLQSDPTRSAINQVDWNVSSWPYLPILPQSTIMSLAGSSTSGNTQAVAYWNDGYLI